MKRNNRTTKNKRTYTNSIFDDFNLDDISKPNKRRRTQDPNEKKGASGPSDCNHKRAMPKVVSCNGTVVANAFKSKVVVANVAKVHAMFSYHSAGPDGKFKNDLTDNITRIIKERGRNATVLGCVAWIGGQAYIDALASCLRTLLIVNREDYATWGGGMLEKYERLPRFDKPLHMVFGHLGSVLGTLEKANKKGVSSYSSIRAFGNPSSSAWGSGGKGKKEEGLEHCKYLIFFAKKKERDDHGNEIEREYPSAVLTGSANFTAASAKHHENAVFIENEEFAMAYFHDFVATFWASTPLMAKNKSATPAMALEKRKKGTLVPGKAAPPARKNRS